MLSFFLPKVYGFFEVLDRASSPYWLIVSAIAVLVRNSAPYSLENIRSLFPSIFKSKATRFPLDSYSTCKFLKMIKIYLTYNSFN